MVHTEGVSIGLGIRTDGAQDWEGRGMPGNKGPAEAFGVK